MPMVRAQILLQPYQLEYLQTFAEKRETSVCEVLRFLVRQQMLADGGTPQAPTTVEQFIPELAGKEG